MSFDEPKIIKQLQSGDKRAFRELVEATQDHVYNTCFSFVKNKEDAEDIAQQVFIEVLRNVHKFRGDAKLSTWMYRIAVNRSLNHLKSVKRHHKVQSLDEMVENKRMKDIPSTEDNLQDPEDEHTQRLEVLQKTIESLPENQKIAITLNNFENLSYQEVADVMGISLSAVTALINRAKVNLRKKIIEHYKKIEKDPQGF